MKKLMLVGAALLLDAAIQAQEEIGAPYNPDIKGSDGFKSYLKALDNDV